MRLKIIEEDRFLLTVEEAARLCSLEYRKALELTRSEWHGFKVGGKWAVPVDEIKTWIDRRKAA